VITTIGPGDALIVVDVQVDFCPGGALAVPEGDRVVDPLRRSIGLFSAKGLPVVFTRDWHPPDHVSFRSRGGPWPAHCVAGTAGAGFHPRLPIPPGSIVVSKASARDAEAYSGFQGTELAAGLCRKGVRRVLVGGLATDYCVKATALDALRERFQVLLLVDAVRAVDLSPGDGERAIEEVVRAGATPLRFEELGEDLARDGS